MHRSSTLKKYSSRYGLFCRDSIPNTILGVSSSISKWGGRQIVRHWKGIHTALQKLMELQKRFEQLQQEYIRIQQDRAKLIDIKAENELVKKDLETFPDDTKVYKMSGPALLPKTLEEAKQAVDEKLSFVGRQLQQLDKQMAEKEKQIIDANKQRLQASQAAKK